MDASGIIRDNETREGTDSNGPFQLYSANKAGPADSQFQGCVSD